VDATVLGQAPGRVARRRAAHWALHPTPLVLSATAPAALRLTALVLASHSSSAAGTGDLDAVSRLGGQSPQQTKELLDRLVAEQALTAWHHRQNTDDILWQFPQSPGHSGGLAR
jgi:predicted DNA-binding transcriptional regulator YafY